MNFSHFAIFSWLLAGFCFIFIQCCQAYGWRINLTDSEPIGLWKLEPRQGAIVPGQQISICPSDAAVFQLARSRGYVPSGKCSGDYAPLFKTVVAVPGDRVTISATGLSVNGTHIINSAPLTKDRKGSPMPSLRYDHYQVAPDSLWLVSSFNSQSFDSRYFGPLPIRLVEGTLQPMLVRNSR